MTHDPYDLIIKHGKVVDGSGLPAFTADVAIRDGRIAKVGRVEGSARRTIDASGKVVDLGGAFSEEGFNWRPAEGVRSVREVLLHTASANFFLGSVLGAKIPDDVNPRELENTVEGKDEVLEVLKRSIDFASAAVKELPEEELATEVDLFGRKAPKMMAVMIIGAHANEHLGQLIAYARTNRIVPPWSR